MFNKLAVIYALCRCIAAGHWFANEFEAGGNALNNGNPTVSGLVAILWPIYASFIFLDEE